MELFRIPVKVVSTDNRPPTAGIVEIARPSFRRRLKKAGILFAVGLVGGVLLLPVPLIHLFGIMFFLAMTGLAMKRLVSKQVLKHASGVCPACEASGDFFVGMGGRRLAFPVSSSCPGCKVGLELWPAKQGAGY